jgi:hypothetical protein
MGRDDTPSRADQTRPESEMTRTRDGAVDHLMSLALAAVSREYPSHVSHLLRDDRDVRPPRDLTPAFFGSFDWHSAVHGHWCLVRLLRAAPRAAFAPLAVETLATSLTREKLAAEHEYMSPPERAGFERPYGLAWLLQLGAELREWDTPDAARWHAALRPLEALAVARLSSWLPRLSRPIRSGEHAQTAFAMGLALDWARVARHGAFTRLLASAARRFHRDDADAPVGWEPSGHDFLSPALGEADLMRRVLDRRAFARWLARFLPGLGGRSDARARAVRRWLVPVRSGDRADGKLAHLDGLNLSRAWMLEGIASVLPDDDRRARALRAAAARHRRAGLAAVTGEHYAGAHWLASFAAYLVTGRGLPRGGAARSA